MIRLLIADDHPIVREGLKRLIEEGGDMEVVGEASSGDELLALARSVEADMILLDVSMPGPGILQTIDRIGNSNSDLRILVLSVQPEEQYAKRTLRAGAHGYLMKDRTPDELLTAIRRISAGGSYVSSAFAERLAFDLADASEKPLHEALSNREYQVLVAISTGKTLKEIGAQLSVSPKTVSSYRARLLEKLDLKTTADLILYGLRHGLDG